MTETATPTPAVQTLPILEAGEYDKYMLRSHAEVLMVLRGLRDHKSQITVFFNEGQDMLLTMLVDVTQDHLIFDVGPDEELNRKAEAAGKHYCVALLEKVRIQFLLGAFAHIMHEGRPAFLSTFPKELLRLQRREFYRLTTPIARPLKCRMSLPLTGSDEHLHEATVFDISGGGIGISAPADDVPFAMQQVITNCRMELPEVGIVTCTIKVCSVFEITLKSGARVKRAGCEFVKLPGPMATLIQRYIIKVERERKARESGLGF
ncbi:MAG: flagellar brake protein [Pseudomonadota bacterium]